MATIAQQSQAGQKRHCSSWIARHMEAPRSPGGAPSPLRAVGAALLRQVAVHDHHLNVSAQPRNDAVHRRVLIELRRGCTGQAGRMRAAGQISQRAWRPTQQGSRCRCRRPWRQARTHGCCARP